CCSASSASSAPGRSPPCGSRTRAPRLRSALVDSLLPPTNGSIAVFGGLRDVGDHVSELAPGRPRFLETNVTRLLSARSHARFELDKTILVGLVVFRTGEELVEYATAHQLPPSMRLVLWTWAPSPRTVLALAPDKPLWVCHAHVTLAVSMPNGTTTLHSAVTDGCQVKWQLLGMSPLDSCSTGASGWRRPNGHPTSDCSAWGPRPHNSPPVVYLERPDPPNEQYREFVGSLVSAMHPPVRTEWVSARVSYRVRSDLAACNLSGLVSYGSSTPIFLPHLRPEWRILTNVVVVVPVGRGPSFSLLKAVTAEFSAELWIASAAALLAMTLALAAASACLGRPRLPAALAVALLQTLAPLLGQPPQGRPAHRPLSAVWLLMSVVLAAAYQGLLLRELTAPPTEINSLEQLEQSGLEVLLSESLHPHQHVVVPTLHSGARFFPYNSTVAVLRRIADDQNSSLVGHFDQPLGNALVQLTREQRGRLHMFQLPGRHLRAYAWGSTKSPLVLKALHSVYLRSKQANLLAHYLHMKAVFLDQQNLGRDHSHIVRPLSLGQLQPAFVLLFVGSCVLSTIVFGLEVLCHRLTERHALARRAAASRARRLAWT
ncbi:Ionotropic receptor 223, partial [Frankliniella occidentalis]